MIEFFVRPLYCHPPHQLLAANDTFFRKLIQGTIKTISALPNSFLLITKLSKADTLKSFHKIYFFFPVIDSLSNLSVRIPEYIQNGHTADLTCSFNLGGDKLYSVKWYKGRHEFYRYMPDQEPKIKIFPVKGMEINVSRQF